MTYLYAKICLHHSRIKSGNKIRKKVKAGVFGITNPGGIVSDAFRNIAKNRNLNIRPPTLSGNNEGD